MNDTGHFWKNRLDRKLLLKEAGIFVETLPEHQVPVNCSGTQRGVIIEDTFRAWLVEREWDVPEKSMTGPDLGASLNVDIKSNQNVTKIIGNARDGPPDYALLIFQYSLQKGVQWCVLLEGACFVHEDYVEWAKTHQYHWSFGKGGLEKFRIRETNHGVLLAGKH